MKYAIDETNRRRQKQIAYNKEHNITPKTVTKKIAGNIADMDYVNIEKNPITKKKHFRSKEDIQKAINQKEKEMLKLANNLEFEKATVLRDEIKEMEKVLLELE